MAIAWKTRAPARAKGTHVLFVTHALWHDRTNEPTNERTSVRMKGVEVSIMRSVINESQAPVNFLHFKFHLCNSPNPFNIIDRFKSKPIFSFVFAVKWRQSARGAARRVPQLNNVQANGIQFRKLIKICWSVVACCVRISIFNCKFIDFTNYTIAHGISGSRFWWAELTFQNTSTPTCVCNTC